MSDFGFFSKHQTWEDWCGMLLGMLIVLSPWFATKSFGVDSNFVVLNAFTVGIVVFGLAQLEYVALQRWQEVTAAFVGLWLMVSPYLFGYSGEGMLGFWHTGLGGLVLLLAFLQLWQDWELTDWDLLRRGP